MYKKTWRNLVKSEGNPIVGKRPHFIFSAEQPYHPAKLQMSSDEVVAKLKEQGLKVETIQGKYGGDERSILIHDVPEDAVPDLNQLASDLGQDSSIYSNGSEHKMFYHHGENAGSYVRGEGTEFHTEAPEDFFSQTSDGTIFTHNFDLDTFHPSNPIKKSEEDDRYLDHYSPKQGLKSINPNFKGEGKDRRTPHGLNPESKFSFYYPGNYENPESEVVAQAKSKYQVKVPKEQKIFDSREHGSDIINQVRDNNQGAFNLDHFVSALKEAGYHGFKSRPKGPDGLEMIAMFEELPVASESPVKPFKFNKSEPDIQKMSRPRIELPNFPEIKTRQDQEVQLIETGRQKKLYGKKVANAKIPDSASMSNKDLKVNRQESRDRLATRLSNNLKNNILGLSVGTKDKAMGAALIGKERSKHEDPGGEYKAKLENHQNKKLAMKQQYQKEMSEWRSKGYEIPWKDDEAVKQHQAIMPQKPKYPRKPSKPRIATKDLSPEQQASRGRQVDGTIEHEGFHNLASELSRNYGWKAAYRFEQGLISQFDLDALAAIGGFITDTRNYKPESPKYREEILAHARDLLVNPKKREDFKNWVGEEKFDQHIKDLKRGYQRAYEYAKKLTPADLEVRQKDQAISSKVAADMGKSENDLQKSELQKDEKNPGLFDTAPASQPSSPSYSENIRNLAAQYAKEQGFEYQPMQRRYSVNQDRAKKIAAAYHDMPHTPDDPQVKEAYDALINETMNQWKAIQQSGLKVTPIQPGQENPYKNSKDVHKDIRENNHLYYFPTDQGFGSGEQGGFNHPMLRQTDAEIGGKPAVANDIFRIVHDYFGHGKEGTGFGPKGEENAWHAHRRMYSPAAQKALTTETRGQNSWVNFGPHGEANRANPANTIYADQKAGLLPDWAMEYDEDELVKKSENDLQKMGMRGDWKQEGYTFKHRAKLAASEEILIDFYKSNGFKSEIEKNMKGLRAGILGAVAASNIASAKPASQDFQQQGVSQATAAQVERPNYQAVPDQKINRDQQPEENNKNHILNAISMVESSGGKNTNHARLPANSIHRGERAFGKYGLTPLLIRETINMNKDLARKYGHMKGLTHDEFHQAMSEHPELEDAIASRHYDRLSKKFGHDPAKIGHSWLNGITGTMRALNRGKDINNHWHVKKITDAYKKVKSGQ